MHQGDWIQARFILRLPFGFVIGVVVDICGLSLAHMGKDLSQVLLHLERIRLHSKKLVEGGGQLLGGRDWILIRISHSVSDFNLGGKWVADGSRCGFFIGSSKGKFGIWRFFSSLEDLQDFLGSSTF